MAFNHNTTHMVKDKEEKKEEPKEEKKAKKDAWSIYAYFAYVDKEGFKNKAEFRSEGETPEAMLTGLEFPAGVNRLVNVTVKHNDETLEKALAPHKARLILEQKSVYDFNAAFRGL